MATEQRPESRIARVMVSIPRNPTDCQQHMRLNSLDQIWRVGMASDLNVTRPEIMIERAHSAGHAGPTKTGHSDMSRELETVLRRLCHTQARRKKLEVLPDWVFLSRRVAAKVTAGV